MRKIGHMRPNRNWINVMSHVLFDNSFSSTNLVANLALHLLCYPKCQDVNNKSGSKSWFTLNHVKYIIFRDRI